MTDTARPIAARITSAATLLLASLVPFFFALVFLLPSVASAAYVRPFLRQTTGVPSGPHAGAFAQPPGLAVDSADHLWASRYSPGSPPPYLLDEFEPSGAYLGSLEIEGPEPLVRELEDPENGKKLIDEFGDTAPQEIAIDSAQGLIFTAGEHSRKGFGPSVEVFDESEAFVRRFGPFANNPSIAIDNTSDSLYLAHGSRNPVPQLGGDGKAPGVEKLSSTGAPVAFTGSAPYISGNQIVGRPGEPTFTLIGGASTPIAVGPSGEIFVGVKAFKNENSTFEVDEYEPSGVFVRSFDGSETPGIAGRHSLGGFGGEVESVTVDAASHHLLVALNGENASAIDEFDIASGKFVGQLTETASGRPLGKVGQMATDSQGDLYAADSTSEGGIVKSSAIDVWGPGRFTPDVRLGEASGRTPTEATLNGSVNPAAAQNPEHSGLAACELQYVTESAFHATGFEDLSTGGEAPCEPAAGSIPAEPEELHHVQATITGLTAGVTYRYRLVATTAGALGGTSRTTSLPFTAPGTPTIEATTVSNLSSGFADLHAQINPRGDSTAYSFQYLTQAEYLEDGESFTGPAAPAEAPIPAADIGSGGETGAEPAVVVQHVGGLMQGTAYRFRVVAANEVGAAVGPTMSFITLPAISLGLPDHRAYELLTPPNKGGAADMFGGEEINNEFENADVGYPSESGDGFLLQTTAAFGSLPGSTQSDYLFSRTPSGWTTTSLTSPSLGLQAPAIAVFNPDLTRVGVQDQVGSSASSAGTANTSLVGPPGGPYATLHVDAGEHFPAPASETTRIVGASEDLGHLVLESDNHTLAPAAAGLDPGARALYESTGEGECNAEAGNCPLLDVKSNGTLLSTCGAVLGQSGARDGLGTARGAVSADGSRVVFTAPDPHMSTGGPGCWEPKTGANPPQIYLRSGGSTVEISKPEAGAPETTPGQLAVYVGAAADDSRVFFLSRSELTADDAGIHSPELYEWRSEGISECARARGCLTRVSAGESGDQAGDVVYVLAVAENGSAVYFLANGALTAGASKGSCHDESDTSCTLYRYDTETKETRAIARLNASIAPDGNAGGWWDIAGLEIVAGLEDQANAYATPDGRYFVFGTTSELTGYATAAADPQTQCKAIPGTQGFNDQHCVEVYRYDSANGSLTCISCNPSGAPPISNAGFAWRSTPFAQAQSPALRPISNDGSYAFFDSGDALVPQDTNGTIDVYEWEAGGTGSCTAEGGCISLISSGHDAAPSFLLGSTPDGSNVFFGTHARLVPQDTDGSGDLYDARICTDSDPCIAPPLSREGECEGDACSHPAPAPNDPTPASATYNGPGNETTGKPAKKHHRRHKQRKKRHRRARPRPAAHREGGRK